MLEFKTIQTLKPNTEILEVIKDYKYKIKNGKVKNLLHVNVKIKCIESIKTNVDFLHIQLMLQLQ